MEKELSEKEKDLLYFKWRYEGIINIIKSLQDSVLLINGVTETVKHEIKKHEGKFFGIFLTPLGASLVQRVISSVVKGISRRGVRKAGRGYMNANFHFHSIL